MAEADIPVDLFNPGQVFACLGFVEAAELLLGEATGTFDWSDAGDVRFRMAASGSHSPIEVVIEFLRSASATALAPHGCEFDGSDWEVRFERIKQDEPYPCESTKQDTLPARLSGSLDDGVSQRCAALIIDYWGDRSATGRDSSTGRDSFKLWAGAQGMPGAERTRRALEIIRHSPKDVTSDPFRWGVAQSSAFRLDWRRDYIPLDAGFSPNHHKDQITMVGYPFVELLAAIGLGHARPRRDDRMNYRYSVVGGGAELAPMFLRAALSGAELPFAQRHFRMLLAQVGKDERCITTVTEEKKR